MQFFPTHPIVLLNAASIFTHLKLYEQASIYLEKLLAQKETASNFMVYAWNGLAKLYHLRSMTTTHEAEIASLQQMAMKSLAESVKCDNANPVTWIQLGLMAIDAKQYMVAIDYFKYVLLKYTNCVSAWCNLGLATLLLGQIDNAEIIYLKGLEVCPDSYQICNNLGNLYRQKRIKFIIK